MSSYGGSTPGEGIRKPKFVPYDAHTLAASAQEMMSKCEQQKRAMPELAVTTKAPVQRRVSEEDEWESQLSKWKSRRRSSGGGYQPKIIDIDVDAGTDISTDGNSQRKQKTFKELSESRSENSGRGYLYPVEDLENINPASPSDSVGVTLITSPNSRTSSNFDSTFSANSAHPMTSSISSSTVLPSRTDETPFKISNGKSDFFTTSVDGNAVSSKTEETNATRRSIIIELPAEKATKEYESRGEKLTEECLKQPSSKAEVKISDEPFWSGDTCNITTTDKGPTMMMRDKATLSAAHGAARPTSALMSSRLAGFQKEEVCATKPDKNPPVPVARIRLNDSPWETKTEAKPAVGVVRRPEPTRGSKVRNFLSQYDTNHNDSSDDGTSEKTSTKPVASVESRVVRPTVGSRQSAISLTKTGSDYGFTVDVPKTSSVSPIKADLSVDVTSSHDEEVKKSEYHSPHVLIPSPTKSEEHQRSEARLSVIPGAAFKQYGDDTKTYSVSPQSGSPLSRSPRPSSPVHELGHTASTSNGDAHKVGLSVPQLSKALGPKLNNLAGPIGGPRPRGESPVVKPRPAPPAAKPKPEAPRTKPKPEPPKPASKPSKPSTDVVDSSAASASSGIILRVSRPEGAPTSDLDLVQSTHLLDSSASKSRSRLSTCGGLAVRRKPTLKGSRPNLTASSTTVQNGSVDRSSKESSSSSMGQIPEGDDDTDSTVNTSLSRTQDSDVFTTSHSDLSINPLTPPSSIEAPPTVTQPSPVEVLVKTKDNVEEKVTDIDDTFDAVILPKETSSDLFDMMDELNPRAADNKIPDVGDSIGRGADLLPPDDAPPPLPSCPPPELNFDTFPTTSTNFSTESAVVPGEATSLDVAASSKEDQMRRKCEFLGLSADQSQEYNALKSTSGNEEISISGISNHP